MQSRRKNFIKQQRAQSNEKLSSWTVLCYNPAGVILPNSFHFPSLFFFPKTLSFFSTNVSVPVKIRKLCDPKTNIHRRRRSIYYYYYDDDGGKSRERREKEIKRETYPERTKKRKRKNSPNCPFFTSTERKKKPKIRIMITTRGRGRRDRERR